MESQPRRRIEARPAPHPLPKPRKKGAPVVVEEKKNASEKAAERKKETSPVDKHIGQRVRMRRMMIGQSQEKLAAALNLTFQQIQKYESGVNRIGGSRMLQIANFLGVPIAFFYEGLDRITTSASNTTPDFTMAFLSTNYGVRCARAFLHVDPKVQRRLVVLLEQIAGIEEPVEDAVIAS